MNRIRKTNEIIIFVLIAFGLLLATVKDTKADFILGEPVNLGPTFNTTISDYSPMISFDDLSFYFIEGDSGTGVGNIWATNRATKDGLWDAPVNLGSTANIPLSAASVRNIAGITTADGLELYLPAELSGGHGNMDLWVLTRETRDESWSNPTNLGSVVNSSADESSPYISGDGLELYFSGWHSENTRPGGYGKADLWVTRRVTRDDPWQEPENLGATVNSDAQDARPSLSVDGLLLFFDSHRNGGYGQGDLYMSRRKSISEPWGEPVNLGPVVNSAAFEENVIITSNGSTLFFDSDRPDGYGSFDIWQVSVEPVVDLNGDGIVDAADLCIIVENWGTDDPLCDIGPTPFGDGVVDVQDLIVLAEHLFEEYPLSDPNI